MKHFSVTNKEHASFYNTLHDGWKDHSPVKHFSVEGMNFWLDHLFRHNNTAAFTGKMSRSAVNLLAFILSCTLRGQRRRSLLI